MCSSAFSITYLLASVTSIPGNSSIHSLGGKFGDSGSEDKPSLPVITDYRAVIHTLSPITLEAFLCSRHRFPLPW